MTYTTPRNAIRNALTQKSPLSEETIVNYGIKVTNRAKSTIERTLRDMLRNGQVVKKSGRYSLSLSATVSTATPPPHGGDAVRQAALSDGGEEDSEEEYGEDLSEDAIWNAVVVARRRGSYALLSPAKLKWLAGRGFLMMNGKGKEWLENED